MELCQDKNYGPKEVYAKLRGALEEVVDLYEWVIWLLGGLNLGLFTFVLISTE